MSDIVLSVEVRERTGKGGARQARRDGFVPGTLYGGDQDPVSIALKNNELIKAINSGKFLANMITISHKGDSQTVFARDVQFDPVKDLPLHVDFQRVNAKDVITVEVSVNFLGEEQSEGIKRGGVLNVVRHAIEVNCPAGQIPEAIDVDISGLDIGDSVHISNVTLPENVEPTITDRDFTIATMQGSRALVEEEAEDEDADADGVEGAEADASEGESGDEPEATEGGDKD
ncbi:50S ribosomal protein L25/general stress protein Ctc [Leptolyngbya valderiana BDU 20041]|nr:50S ribosomal protein L25/general stress protein Ctc [Leptolyngbya valderiana BDU 20041]